MKKKVVISVGPIPGKLDSVKYITNKFKGGLGFKTAAILGEFFDVTVVKWKNTEYSQRNENGVITHTPGFKWVANNIEIVDVDDVYEYYEYMKKNRFDAYILAGAIANLVPVEPWEGKFPSHNYKEDEEFDIKFKIAPRIINMIKKRNPRASLIGYKLFDGTDQELIEAGWETLIDGKCNVVFCNRPSTAKTEKIALLPDGSQIKMNFDEHIEFIKRLLSVSYYKTEIDYRNVYTLNTAAIHTKINEYLKLISKKYGKYDFGTVAYFSNDYHFPELEFMTTTTRGKKDLEDITERGEYHKSWDIKSDHFVKVYKVENGLIEANKKATMNSPFLWELKKKFPETKVILHGHQLPDDIEQVFEYAIPGTNEESDLVPEIGSKKIYIKHHGYYCLFDSVEEADKWLHSKETEVVERLVTPKNTSNEWFIYQNRK